MADSAPQKKGPRIPVATPNISGPAAGNRQQNNAPPPDMNLLLTSIGTRIRLTNSLNQSQEGTLFAVDPILNLVALSQPTRGPPNQTSKDGARPQDFHLVLIAKISKFEVLNLPAVEKKDFATAMPKIKRVNSALLKEKVNKAVQAEKKLKERIGKGVGKEAQDIFDAIERMFPTRWEGKSMVVLNSIKIDPPYTLANCKALGNNAKELARVKMQLEHERKKIADKKAADRKTATKENTSSVPNDMRKGG
ncbi:MAG: hypothetical protein M1814_001794 [Vezdaea aestivalis]|nr:MAG: hypothetical protein M1814_001794 [Vezdaea aestivalis]